MPRAPTLNQIDMREFAISCDYLKGSLESVIKAKLDTHDNGLWLVNPASKQTYATYLIGKPHAQTGMVKITFGVPGMKWTGASWLVLHEAVGNKAYLLNFDHFCGFLKQVAESPLAAGGFCTVVHEGSLVHVNLHLDWAIANKLVKLAAPLKGSYLAWRERKLATKEDFVHLHCHSEFSLLDGATAIDQVGMRAMLNGQPGIALTDHGYCFGSFKHWKACTDLGIKPLMGCEIYLVDDVNQKYVDDQGVTRRFEHHLTLIAMTQEGWANLCKMLTRGCRDHYYYVPRIDWAMLAEHSAGIYCLSGCFKGPAAHYLQVRQPREGEAKLPWWLEKNPDRALQNLRKLQAIFPDRLAGECMNIDFEQYNACLPELLAMFDHCGIPKVISNDCHYEREEDARIQAMLTRISNQKVDGLGEQIVDKGVYFIRQRSEMEAGAPWATPDMFDRTCQIMERCDLTFKREGYLFPHFNLRADPDWPAFETQRPKA